MVVATVSLITTAAQASDVKIDAKPYVPVHPPTRARPIHSLNRDARSPFTTREGMGVRFAGPVTKHLEGSAKESCHRGLRKNMSGSMRATVAVGGTGGLA